MKKEVEEIYQSRINIFSEEEETLGAEINKMVVVRGVLFLAGLAASIISFGEHIGLGVVVTVSFLSVFLYVVMRHARLESERLQLKTLININIEEIDRLAQNYKGPIQGSAYLEMNHLYAGDLDLFGKGSLFHYLNRTSVLSGKDCLANWLLEAADKDEIVSRQGAIKELKDKIDWRQNLQVIGRLGSEKERDLGRLMKWLDEPSFFENIDNFKKLTTLLPLITMGFLGTVGNVYGAIAFFTCVIIQMIIRRKKIKKIRAYHVNTQGTAGALSIYKTVLQNIEEEDFKSEKLAGLQNNVTQSETSGTAIENLNSLESEVKAIDRGLNVVIGFAMNVVFMWDLRCIIRLEEWKAQYKNEMKKWFVSIKEVDALASLGTFYFNNPAFTIPKITADKFIVEATELGHPLVDEEKRICNNLSIDGSGKFMLVTGSNMAGKSTFIRSVGINLVLAMAGAPVCAKEFEFMPVKICTSMRVSDSLHDGESSFYVELKRWREILNVLNN